VIDRYGVLIPENTPPGIYTIEVGLYDFKETRLPASTGGDALMLASAEVH